MTVIERNLGPKVSYQIEGSRIYFGDALSIDLSRYELDDENHIFICSNRDGCLYSSIYSNMCYVAEIVIPPRRYIASHKAVYEGSRPVVSKTAVPFDMGRCTLALFGME